MKDARNLSNQTYDVIIAGAGPAGCSAAIFLAKQNFHVCLLDKEHFPRDKTCGDGLSSFSLTILERLGVLDKLEQHHAWPIHEMIIGSPSGAKLHYTIDKPGADIHESGLVMPRKILDHLLLEEVKTYSNVDVYEGLTVTDLLRENSAITGVMVRHQEESIPVKARFVIGADGVHSRIAQKLSLRNRAQNHKAFCVRAYFSGVEDIRNALEFYYEKDVLPGYAWIIPTGKDSANVGIGVYNRFKPAKDLRLYFQRFIDENPFVKDRLKNAVMEKGTYKGWPLLLGTFPGPRSLENVLLIGDAASFIDPVAGEGMFYALRSGEIAAAALSKIIHKGEANRQAAPVYEKLWRKDLQANIYTPGYLVQYLLSKPAIVDFGIKTASKSKQLTRIIMGLASHSLPGSQELWQT